jgi:hypothetical protein
VTLRTDCEQQHSVQAGRSMSVIPIDFRRSGKEKFRKKAPHPSMTLEFGVSLIGLAAEAAGRSHMDPLFRDHGQSRALPRRLGAPRRYDSPLRHHLIAELLRQLSGVLHFLTRPVASKRRRCSARPCPSTTHQDFEGDCPSTLGHPRWSPGLRDRSGFPSTAVVDLGAAKGERWP